MKNNMNFKFTITTIAISSILVLLISLFIFGNNSFGFLYFIGNVFALLTCLILFQYIILRIKPFPINVFYKKIFWISFIYRIFIILVIYLILQKIGSGDIGIEEYDTVFYDNFARDLAYYYKNGFSFADVKSFFNLEFDDKGYIFILSLIYFIFDNILFAKLLQGLVDSISVILVAKITTNIFNERIGKTAGSIAAIFLPMIVIASLHTKEVFMIFFLLLAIYYSTKLVKKNFNLKYVSIIIISIIVIFSLRIIIGFFLFISIIYYIFINYNKSFTSKILSPFIFITIFIFSINYFGIDKPILEKIGGYFGYDVSDEIKIGGRSVVEIESKGQNYAKYAYGVVTVPQVIITPYPSFVRTNIKMYDTTMQWYFTAGLFLWSFLSFYAFIGIYYAIKYKFKESSIIFIILILYIIVLVISLYITSIRFNIPKLVLLIIFSAVGMHYPLKRPKNYFLYYSITICIIIIGWNYIKLAGRGIV